MKLSLRHTLLIVVLATAVQSVVARELLPDSIKTQVAATLTRIAQTRVTKCPVAVERIEVKGGKVEVYASTPMSYFPVREGDMTTISDSVRAYLPAKFHRAKVEIYSDGENLASLTPLALRTSRRGVKPFVNNAKGGALVRPERPYKVTEGLSGRHIALWQSHGRYFDYKTNEWSWQRPLLWQTVEDLFTQSYVVPYLVPMLERAGATVLLPRERDFQTTELIADNDRSAIDSLSDYVESRGARPWTTLNKGFAHRRSVYLSGENPFTEGTSRTTTTVTSHETPSRAIWSAKFPEAGEYAVYVTYQSLPNSTTDALYTINHSGGASSVKVNQSIGGGTWIYLGTYHFRAGESCEVVTLSNHSSTKGRTICADAVKIGGGMGNIARTVCDSLRVEGGDYTPIVSGMPRYCEGARYWLQWAGFSEAVYNPHNNCDDYKDDYKSRGEWVNALMGGSDRLSKSEGLGIPVDMSLAFHSDAGVTDNDTTIGTLGIYYTKFNKGRFEDGEKRTLSRDLTDLVMSQIVADIRHTYDEDWSRRGMWNRSYFEARVPSVPAMLLELLSHQNLADMRLGHDPNFKFTVSRAIYKAILKHLAAQYNKPYRVAPLPVEAFSLKPEGEGVRLTWSPTADPLEVTATAEGYILYTRKGNGGFDNGRHIKDTTLILKQERDIIYSYRITAINGGGESFPSEILSSCITSDNKHTALIINGFNKVSAPEVREDGFHNEFDSGVAYIRDVAFVGEQKNHDTSKRRSRNTLNSFGASHNNHQGSIVGGNTFDYPYTHGRALLAAGCSFYSTSAAAVERGDVPLTDYDMIDVILGKQRATSVGLDSKAVRYRCFSPTMQNIIADYTTSGGALFVSGAYIATDLFEGQGATQADAEFAKNQLHISLASNMATAEYTATTHSRQATRLSASEYTIASGYRPDYYPVNSVDAFDTVGDGATPLIYYKDSGLTAAVGWRGTAATFVMGFPFESVMGEAERNAMMTDIVKYLLNR